MGSYYSMGTGFLLGDENVLELNSGSGYITLIMLTVNCEL